MTLAKLLAFSRYRPRALTVLVLLVVAALIVLANLSDEIRPCRALRETLPPNLKFDLREPQKGESYWLPQPFTNVSYGWPLLWRQHVTGPYGAKSAQCYSGIRFIANVALWLVMLAAAAGLCEWLLRRYRPRLRWSLRTMLAAVAVVGACCAWFASLRDRASVQDPVIEALRGLSDDRAVYVERWGPRWLGVVGADRFCRRVVGAAAIPPSYDEEKCREYPELLERLARLPNLQCLVCKPHPALGDTLADMRQLRVLSVSGVWSDDGGRMPGPCLAAIGKSSQLEHLRLCYMTIDAEDLACLTGLNNLKSLSLWEVDQDNDKRKCGRALLADLPALPSLEAVDLWDSRIGDHDLRCLAAIPRLKSLSLMLTDVSGDGLSQLAMLPSLEELTLEDSALSLAGLQALVALKSLKKLHFDITYGRLSPNTNVLLDDGSEFDVPPDEIEEYRRAFAALRRSHPGIVIDADDDALDWHEDRTILSQFTIRQWGDPQPGAFWWQWRKERE